MEAPAAVVENVVVVVVLSNGREQVEEGIDEKTLDSPVVEVDVLDVLQVFDVQDEVDVLEVLDVLEVQDEVDVLVVLEVLELRDKVDVLEVRDDIQKSPFVG